jgi:hypothetical protein
MYVAGSQMWFSKETRLDKKLHGFGCGIVALHDLCVYRGLMKAPLGRDEFKKQIRAMEKGGMFVVPRHGIAPYYYHFLCNNFLIRKKIPLRIEWGHGPLYENRTGLSGIKNNLEKGFPTIFAVGPTYPFIFKKKYLTLYNTERKPSGYRTKAHYMTILDITESGGETWLEIASWGKQFSIKFSELYEFSKMTVPLTTRFYSVREKRRNT